MAINKTNIKDVEKNFAKFDLALICEDRYKELKHTDMVVYTMLKNQESLSIASVKNGNMRYVDSNGYVFISISQKKLCKLLKLSNPTLKASLDRLEKCELIENMQVGTMQCNRIYVGNTEATTTLGDYIKKIGIELENEKKEEEKKPSIKVTNKKDLSVGADKSDKANKKPTTSISKDKEKYTGKSKQNVKTRFHNINTSFDKYEAEELELNLKKSQEGKFGNKEQPIEAIETVDTVVEEGEFDW